MHKSVTEIEAIAKSARISALQMTSKAKAAHIGSSLSMIDILSTIYNGISNIEKNPKSIDQDIVLVSKGHAAAGAYAVMGHSGLLPLEYLSRYCTNGAELGGHVTTGTSEWVKLSTGSLGHALPFGVGIALSTIRDGGTRNIFVLLSDGELDEGSNWEAALQASHLKLSNLYVFIDRNRLQSLRSTEETITLEPLSEKWSAFGWDVVTVDGHSVAALIDAFIGASESVNPTVFICDTVKGKGVSFMEGSVAWHYKSANEDELSEAIKELEESS